MHFDFHCSVLFLLPSSSSPALPPIAPNGPAGDLGGGGGKPPGITLLPDANANSKTVDVITLATGVAEDVDC